MKENYIAWNLRISDYSESDSFNNKLKFFIKFGILAPSSHNTQPWKFKIEANSIVVSKENSRRLPIADKLDRQLSLSIGCAIENIVIAADYFGYKSKVQYNSTTDNSRVAVIDFEQIGRPTDDKNHLAHFITSRKTNRGKYSNQKIKDEVINRILSLSDHDIEISIIMDKNKIFKIGDVAVVSSIESMIDDEFRHELSHHLKHNYTKSKIGMPGFTLGIPTPISFLLPTLMKKFNMEKAAQKQNESLFRMHTPYILVISTNNDTKYDWLNAGRIFEKLSLIAASQGISLSPWGAPIEIGEFYKDIQKILNTNKRPQMLNRMGFALKSSRHSPRLNIEDVIN